MSWKSVIVGVDGSEESVRAAQFGVLLGELTGAPCRLVHAVPEYWTAVPPIAGIDMTELNRQSVEQGRRLIQRSLHDLPDAVIRGLESRVGSAAMVLSEAAAEDTGADVVVMGGKHHRGLGRLMGSSILHLVRLGAVPVLAHAGLPTRLRRVLAAVDLTPSAGRTIATAAAWAEAFGAKLRVLHVVEPLPVVPGVTLGVPDDDVYLRSQEMVETELRPYLNQHPEAEMVTRRGRSAGAIVLETRTWGADLIVASSHGKDWMDRLVIGSTSERLLHVLAAPTLILPAGGR